MSQTETVESRHLDMLIEAVSARYCADEAAIVERLLREYNNTIPDRQLVHEIGLALAIHRHEQRKRPPSM